MTCKDCLHRDGCCNFVPIEGTIEEKAEYLYECLKKPCKDFKSKADFVEVVRCRDCKHFKLFRSDRYSKGECTCRENGLFEFVKPTDFCSYGERRKENE